MAKNTIRVKSYLNVQDEKVANAAITPGHLIERMSTDKVRKHASADGPVFPMFALENALEGEGITDAYSATDTVFCWIPTQGDQVYAHISVTDVSIGDLLVSAGDGTLRKHDIASSGAVIQDSNIIVGRALEAITAGNQGVIEII